MKPLQGRRILVTRRSEQAGSLVEALSALGAAVVEVPLIAQAPPEDMPALDAALARLGGYDWLAFTSANGVAAVADRLAGLGASLPAQVRMASVGPTTTGEIAARFAGRRAELEPESAYRAENLVDAFRAYDLRGRRVLLPVSDRARDTLAQGLRAQGATVDVVIAYRTIAAAGAAASIGQALDRGIDLVTLASPSAVEAFVAAAGDRSRGVALGAIGPVTAQAARAAGLQVAVEAEPGTAEGLVRALVRHFARPGGPSGADAV